MRKFNFILTYIFLSLYKMRGGGLIYRWAVYPYGQISLTSCSQSSYFWKCWYFIQVHMSNIKSVGDIYFMLTTVSTERPYDKISVKRPLVLRWVLWPMGPCFLYPNVILQMYFYSFNTCKTKNPKWSVIKIAAFLMNLKIVTCIKLWKFNTSMVFSKYSNDSKF